MKHGTTNKTKSSEACVTFQLSTELMLIKICTVDTKLQNNSLTILLTDNDLSPHNVAMPKEPTTKNNNNEKE